MAWPPPAPGERGANPNGLCANPKREVAQEAQIHATFFQ